METTFGKSIETKRLDALNNEINKLNDENNSCYYDISNNSNYTAKQIARINPYDYYIDNLISKTAKQQQQQQQQQQNTRSNLSLFKTSSMLSVDNDTNTLNSNYEKLKLLKSSNTNIMTNSLVIDSSLPSTPKKCLNMDNNSTTSTSINPNYSSLLIKKRLNSLKSIYNNKNTINSNISNGTVSSNNRHPTSYSLRIPSNNRHNFNHVNKLNSNNNNSNHINSSLNANNNHSIKTNNENIDINTYLSATKCSKRAVGANGYVSDSECNMYANYYNNRLRINNLNQNNFNYNNENSLNNYQNTNPACNANKGSMREQLNQFYNYLERTNKYRRNNSYHHHQNSCNDDTQSCVNMKLSTYRVPNTTNEKTISQAQADISQVSEKYKNSLKLSYQSLDKQQQLINEIENYNKLCSNELSCLFTPRMPKKQVFSIYNSNKGENNSNRSNMIKSEIKAKLLSTDNSSHTSLTWKNFNCNPLPLNEIDKETSIVNDSNTGSNELTSLSKHDQIKSFTHGNGYHFNNSNQNLATIYDENYCLNNKENYEYKCTKNNYTSMSTPGTPLLSSYTLPRHRFSNQAKLSIDNCNNELELCNELDVKIDSDQSATEAFENVTAEIKPEIVIKASINQNLSVKDTVDAKDTKNEIVPLENALLNMNEVLKNLTLNAQNKQNELEEIKKLVTSFEPSVNILAQQASHDTTAVTTTISPLNISPSLSLSSSLSNSSSKQSSSNSSASSSLSSSSPSSVASDKSTSDSCNSAANGIIKAKILKPVQENEVEFQKKTNKPNKKSTHNPFSNFSFNFGKKLRNLLTSNSNGDSNSNRRLAANIDCQLNVNTVVNEQLKANEVKTKFSNLTDIRLDLENKLKELEVKNSSDYLLIQNLKSQIARNTAYVYKQ